MTTRRPGGRPRRVVNVATSSATARRISSAIGPPSRRRARGGRPGQGRSDGGDRLARFAVGDELAGLGRQALDLVEQLVDARGHLVLVVGIADRRQVDQDVGRGTAGSRLAEERGDVEIARGVDVAPAGQRLGGGDQLDAGLDAAERDLGGDARGRLERRRPDRLLVVGVAGHLHRGAETA